MLTGQKKKKKSFPLRTQVHTCSQKQVWSLFKFNVHHCLFSPKCLQGKMLFFFFFAPTFAESLLLHRRIHSHSHNPVWSGCQPTWSSSPISQHWVWNPSASQRRVRGARGHRATVCLPPSSLSPFSLTLSLGHVLPHHPQNHFSSLSRPSFPPSAASRMAGWWVNTDRAPQARPGLLPHYNHKELPHFWVEPVAAGGSGAFKWVAYLIGFV